MLPIAASEAARVQQDDAALIANIFRAYGVGGSAWTLTRRASGDGMSAGTVTTRTLADTYVALRSDVGLPVNPIDTSIPSDAWTAISLVERDIQAYDVITALADASLSFTVQTVTRNSAYVLIAQLAKNDSVGTAY